MEILLLVIFFIFIILVFYVICVLVFKRMNKNHDTNAYLEHENIVCREVAEIYCNTVSCLNELCSINKKIQNSLEKFVSSVSINKKMETHQLKKIEEEVDFRIKEVNNIATQLPALKFNATSAEKMVLEKHNLSVAEVVSAESCVTQSIQDMISNLMSLKEQLGLNHPSNLLGINFALARLRCFQFECNAMFYGALEGLCSFPNDSLGIYYEMASGWDCMPKGVAIKSFDKKHFKMCQEMEFQKSQKCLDEAQIMIDNADNDVENLIKGLKCHDVNFFIAGSKELQQERDVFAGVVSLLQTKWKPLGLDIYSYSYLNFPRDVTIKGHQEQYNSFIANHVNASVFILSGKAGGYTKMEFDVAFDNFIKKGTPKIFVYSLDNEDNECDSYIHTKMIEEKQYWIEYKNIQELRLLIERDLNNCLIDEFSKATDAFSL